MPATVVVGGQYGSEGKGKVSAFLADRRRPSAIVRVGGPNSGHTAVDASGRTWTFRQLPAALASKSEAPVVLPAGSLIDKDILLEEVARFGLPAERLWIDPKASVVLPRHKSSEAALIPTVGSTASGTGASLIERIGRSRNHRLAGDCEVLRPFIRNDLGTRLRRMLRQSERILIEGTQGFGLSLWHSGCHPFATSRDTTAAAFVSESGLAPHDVDQVVLVIRTFPIRVGGNSGPLSQEIDWDVLAREANLPAGYKELTTATGRIRRIGRFDPNLVRAAVEANAPHLVVLNHMDYVDPSGAAAGPSGKSRDFIRYVEKALGSEVSLVGYGPADLVPREQVMRSRAA